MARLGVAGIALALVLAPDIAMAAIDSAVGAPPVPPMPVMRSAPPMMPPPGATVMTPTPPGATMVVAQTMPMPMPPKSGPDRGSYQQPGYGYMLPRYWVAPAHFIADPAGFGLPRPAWGYGWSRYYDDVVLTDRWGRVYDWRSADDMRRDRMGGEHHRKRRDKTGIVGAIIGGAVGALTGNVIAGAGNRLAGSLIGGGVGALAGQALDKESSRGGRHHDRYGDATPLMRPHWDMAYLPEPVFVEEASPPECHEVKTVRYVTDYVPVRAKVKPRTKYVPVHRAKEVPLT